MYNQQKIAGTKKIVFLIASLLLVVLGVLIGVGLTGSNKPTKEVKEISQAVTAKPPKELSTKQVEAFLIAYYTKKDLGENRIRYEPLVTMGLLNELKEIELEPVNQAYKGYIVDQVFESADIYVDTVNSSAIAMVTYKNTQLATKGTYENSLANQTHQESIKLTFLQQGKKYLVNRVDYVTLSQPLSHPRNTYKVTNDTIGVQQVEETSKEAQAIQEVTENDTYEQEEYSYDSE